MEEILLPRYACILVLNMLAAKYPLNTNKQQLGHPNILIDFPSLFKIQNPL